MVERSCKGCETVFTTAEETKTWCSRKCRTRCRKREQYRRSPWYQKQPKFTVRCRCGADYESLKPTSKYCSGCRHKPKGPCAGCGGPLPKWHRKYCAACRPLADILRDYSVTPAQYREMVERQGGRCAICGASEKSTKSRLGVDHCHRTGEPRGLLCGRCNAGIGLLGDSPTRMRKAAAYLAQCRMRFKNT